MWERFNERAKRVVFFAQEEAWRLGEDCVSTEHLLLGLLRERDNVACSILEKAGVSVERLRNEIERQVTRGDLFRGPEMQLNRLAQHSIELARNEAKRLKHDCIGTEHLLLGLIREGKGLAGRVLATSGVELEHIRHELLQLQDNAEQKADRGHPQI